MHDTNEDAKAPYRGPERRRGMEPRKGDDRRDGIRYEPLKPLRRHGRDRRSHYGWDDTPLR